MADCRRPIEFRSSVVPTTDGSATRLLEGPPSHWIEELTRFVTDLGFDTFVFWPGEDHP